MLMRARWVASGCAAQSERAGFAKSERPRCLLGAQLAIIVVPPFVYSLPAMTNTSTEVHAIARSVNPHPHHCVLCISSSGGFGAMKRMAASIKDKSELETSTEPDAEAAPPVAQGGGTVTYTYVPALPYFHAITAFVGVALPSSPLAVVFGGGALARVART
jgi:hypothetical protein